LIPGVTTWRSSREPFVVVEQLTVIDGFEGFLQMYCTILADAQQAIRSSASLRRLFGLLDLPRVRWFARIANVDIVTPVGVQANHDYA